MADNLKLEAGIDINRLINDLGTLRTEGEKIRLEFDAVNKSLTNGFNATSTAAGGLGDKIQTTYQKIGKQQQVIALLVKELEELRKTGGDAFEPEKVKSYQAAIESLEKELADLRKGFTGTGNSAENLADNIDGRPRSIGGRFRSLIGNIRSFAVGAREGFNDAVRGSNRAEKSVDQLNAELAELQKRMNSTTDLRLFRNLQGEAERVRGEISRVSGDFGNDKKPNSLVSSIKRVGTYMGAYFAIDRLVALGRGIFNTRSEFEKFETVLTNTLGTRSEAIKAMAMIQDFAAKTPFQVDELTDSFVKLANRGFIPTRDELTKIGDLAASQGKSFNQLTEAILDAQTGEYERLKEFGIKAKTTGNTVALSFKGVTKEVNKSEEAIRNAIIAMGGLEGVAGGMDSLSKTMGGVASNISDNFTGLMNNIGKKSEGFIMQTLTGVNSIVQFMSEAFGERTPAIIKPLFDGIASWWEGLKRVNTAVIEFLGFSGGMDDFRGIIVKIGDAVGAIFTSLGMVLDQFARLINYGSEVQGMGSGFMSLKDQINGVLDEIIQIPHELAAMGAGITQFGQNIANAFQKAVNMLEIFRFTLQKAFTFDDAAEAAIQRKIDGLVSANKKMTDSFVSGREAYNKAYAASVKDSQERARMLKEFEDNAKEREAGQDLTINGRKVDTKQPKFDPDAAKKIKASQDAQKKADQERLEKLRQIADLEKQLAQAKIDAMDEGRMKDMATEIARYQAAVDALEVIERKTRQSLKTSRGENRKLDMQALDLINQNIEAQQSAHTKKMLDINNRYYKDAIKAFTDAQDSINGLLFTDEQKEVAAVNKTFDSILKAIEDARKAALQATDEPLTISFINTNAELQKVDALEALQKALFDITVKFAKLRLDEEEELAKASVDIIKIQGLNEANETVVKERLKLQIEAEFAKKRLDALKKQYNLENILTDNIINALTSKTNIEAADAQGMDIFEFLGIAIKDDKAKIEILKAVKAVQDTGEAAAKAPKKAFDLMEILGIDAEGEKNLRMYLQAANELTENMRVFSDAMVEIYDRQIEARQRNIDKIQEEIDAQQEAIDREKELMEQGYANNLDIENRRMADLKAQRDAEVKEQERIAKEKQRIQRIQLIADTAVQASNLVTASTDIIRTYSGIPGGTFISLALIGTMIAGFIASKVAAFQAIKDVPKFEKGGTMELYNALNGAPSHKEGGAKLVNSKTGDVLAEFEGNEKLFAVNKKSSKKFEPLLEAINNDELSTWSYDRIKGFIKPTEISIDRSQRSEIKKTERHSVTNVVNIAPRSEKELKVLKDIDETNRAMLELEKNREIVTEFEDRTEIVQGNYKRIIRKVKK